MTISYLLCTMAMSVVIVIIILLTFLMEKRKLLIKEVIIILPVFLIIMFYYWNYDFNLFVKSNIFPEEYYSFHDRASGQEHFIKLPKGSVWLFKTPTEIYYSKGDTNSCQKFFYNELNQMIKRKIADSFTYIDEKRTFEVKKQGKTLLEIELISDADSRRFGIYYDVD